MSNKLDKLDKMENQKLEFDACRELALAYLNSIEKCSIVDDDYPEVRHKYEEAVNRFLEACKNNGRS